MRYHPLPPTSLLTGRDVASLVSVRVSVAAAGHREFCPGGGVDRQAGVEAGEHTRHSLLLSLNGDGADCHVRSTAM
jgi:hypothetical protein